MDPNEFEPRFPHLRPIRSVPTLSHVNGFGLMLYGDRDRDPDSGTYVKTHCFCLLFVPIFAVGAYRVADAPGGWYFLGREPLSGLAKMWNCFVLLALLSLGGGIGWHYYSGTPDYKARRAVAEAEELAAAGKLGPAARLLRDVALGKTGHAPAAAAKLNGLLDAPAATAPLAEVAEACKVAAELELRPGAGVADVAARGLAAAEKRGADDVPGALAVLDTVLPFAPDANAVWSARQRLLEPAVEKQPDDAELAGQLALVYEAQNQLPKCEALLTRHRPRLGTTEGARILGRLYAQQNKFDEAHALLEPYVEARLGRLHAAERAWRGALEEAHRQIADRVNSRNADDFPYEEYRKAPEQRKRAIQEEYVSAKVRDDPAIRAAQEELRRVGSVVPAALDLGLVCLHRGQATADPAARKKELERAEKAFLSVRDVAGESDAYRLSLGQVYYWLGRHDEGRKLFDELLEHRGRGTEMMIGVANVLREVGADREARALVEEAYNKESDARQKHEAASVRALLRIDLDDEITWLGRADPADSEIKASLSMALGNRALQQGNDVEAARQLREAIAAYARMPETSATLNNGALAYLSLHRVTGETEALDQALKMTERALTLKPSDSILLGNTATRVLEAAARDLTRAAVDLKALKRGGGLELLSYLYDDAAGRDRQLERLRQHPGIVKALAYFERLAVLAPKRPGAYGVLAYFHRLARDRAALRRLWERLDAVDLDQDHDARATREYLAGQKDEQRRPEFQASVKRAEEALRAGREKGGVTLAVAATQLLRSKTDLHTVGGRVDADELVALAEEAHKAAPSSATRSNLQGALLFRASAALARQDADYAKTVAHTRRSLGAPTLIAVALSGEGKSRALALADPDVQRVVELVRENVAKFPDDPSEWDWVMLRATHPEEAEKVAQKLAANETDKLDRLIDLKLQPMDATTAFRAYWAFQLAGDEVKGREILKAYAARGVPLPFDVK